MGVRQETSRAQYELTVEVSSANHANARMVAHGLAELVRTIQAQGDVPADTAVVVRGAPDSPSITTEQETNREHGEPPQRPRP